MNQSDWIEREISYSLRKTSRDGTQSLRNGVVAVIQKINGSYDWLKTTSKQEDGCKIISYKEDLIPEIIRKNRRNQEPVTYLCDKCRTISSETGSYISIVEEDDFINAIGTDDDYIEKAFKKCENDCAGYDIKVEL